VEPTRGPDHPTDPDRQLATHPAEPAGWQIPVPCSVSHELGPVIVYQSGLLVAHCKRCAARCELPWFRGGSAATLARAVATEALNLPNPAGRVVDELEDLALMLEEDRDAVDQALDLIRTVREILIDRIFA
jgi:hypothetical protein